MPEAENKQPELNPKPLPASPAPAKAPRKSRSRLSAAAVALIAVLVIAGAAAAGFGLDHVSRTNPQFCGTCHNMTEHVTSYTTSNHLDNVHFQAGVGCKECHSDYSIPQELASGVSFITGDYSVPMEKIKVKDDMCLQCHISNDHVAAKTDFLPRNPHDNHNIGLRCTVCHVSHGEQVDYCADCHDNGGQRMIEEEAPPGQREILQISGGAGH